MLPFLQFKIGEQFFLFPTNFILDLFCLSLAIGILLFGFRKQKYFLRIPVLVISIMASGIWGGRLFHALWERPELLKHPLEIFTRLDGKTFYGAFIGGTLAFFWGVRLTFKPHERLKAWNLGAIIVAISYGILRVGCFAWGCCWGKVCTLPWAVRFYNPQSVMPLLGIPVHPVQLYDSFLGFLTAGILIYLYRKKPTLPLFAWFCVMYGVGRFFTEFFRADEMRRSDVLLHLSTSQLISVAIVSSAGAYLYFKEKKMIFRSQRLATVGALLVTLGLSSCILPSAPKVSDYDSLDTSDGTAQTFVTHPKFNPSRFRHERKGKNALFMASDSWVQKGYTEQIKQAYKTDLPQRLEVLSWWQFFPELSEIYDEIIYIPYDKVGFNVLERSILKLEAAGQPYDLILLTHGAPNYLSSGENYFLSWEELATWKGKLRHLNLVFMQACYGSTLAPDWLAAGAKHVISYTGLNRNFFYFGNFINWYKTMDVFPAYLKARQTMPFFLSNSILYTKILGALRTNVGEYLNVAGKPQIDSAEVQ